MGRPPERIAWRRVLSLLRPLRRGLAAMVGLSVLGSLAGLVPPITLGYLINDLVDYARWWRPDLVLWEPTTYAGAIAAKACGAAHGRILIGEDVFGLTRDHFLRLRPPGAPDPLGAWLAAYAEKYGAEFSEDMVTGQFTIDQLPASLRHRANLTHVPMRYVNYGGAAVIPDWLSTPPSRPRIALTMGLTAHDRTGGYPVDPQDVLDAVDGLDVELVATVSPETKPSRIPPGTRLVSFVPLTALLSTCSVAIHHGGVGTLASTALRGIPQLTLPWDVDQPTLGARLAAQDAGVSIHATEATTEGIRDALTRLLTEPAYAKGAAHLRDELLAMPSPHEVVRQLTEG